MTPSARKDMARPVAVKDTLSAAGRATVLTASEVLQELKALDEAKEDKRVQDETTKRVPEQKVAETAQKDAERERLQSGLGHTRRSRGRCKRLGLLLLRMWPSTLTDPCSGQAASSEAKKLRSLAAARVRAQPLTPRQAWAIIARR